MGSSSDTIGTSSQACGLLDVLSLHAYPCWRLSKPETLNHFGSLIDANKGSRAGQSFLQLITQGFYNHGLKEGQTDRQSILPRSIIGVGLPLRPQSFMTVLSSLQVSPDSAPFIIYSLVCVSASREPHLC